VVNATGGLVDTVSPETGFVMAAPTAAELVAAVQRAVAAYRDPKIWRRLQTNGMSRDFGWGSAARAYADIYRGIKPTS
jgi:starch synthase